MTLRRFEIAEIVPETVRQDRPQRGTTPQRRGAGFVWPVASPTIVLTATDHYELIAQRTGNYRFRVNPNVTNSGILFEIYNDTGFDRRVSSYWNTQGVGVPGAFGFPQEDGTLAAGSGIWMVDLHLNAGEFCAWQGIGPVPLSGALEVEYTGDTAPAERMGIS